MHLIFVYNAETDVISSVLDYAHKLFKPETYKCELCALTHHNFGERKVWKEFKSKTNANLSFWYIRQFEQEFGQRFEYPVIFEKTNETLKIVRNKSQLEEFHEVEDLIKALKNEITQRSK